MADNKPRTVDPYDEDEAAPQLRSEYRFPVKAADAPAYMQYPNVTGSYRVGGNYWDAIKSLFQAHTETINAWSMIIGNMMSVILTVYVCCVHVKAFAVPVFIVFALSPLIHLPFSLGFHLFMPIGIDVFSEWRKLDVTAIFACSVLLTFSLSCFVLPWWGTLLITMVTAAVAGAAVRNFGAISDDYILDHAKHSVLVSTVVICYWFPMAFALVRDALDNSFTLSSAMTVGVVTMMTAAAYCFSVGFPEILAPGLFDVLGHSHQLMHLAIIIAHFFEFVFILDNYNRLVTGRRVA